MLKPESRIEAVLLRLEKRMDSIENDIRDLNERIENASPNAINDDLPVPAYEEDAGDELCDEDCDGDGDEGSVDGEPRVGDENDNSREGITENILRNFNFARVEKVMKFLDWTWYSTGKNPPNTEQIAALAESLLVSAWKDLSEQPYDSEGWREWTVGTGGFVAWVCEGNILHNHERYASLKFVVEDWDVGM